MDIMNKLHRSKTCDSYYEIAKDEAYKLSRSLQEADLNVEGWIKNTRWDKREGDSVISSINFSARSLKSFNVEQEKDSFSPVYGISRLSDCRRSRNLPFLIRVSKMRKYLKTIKKFDVDYAEMEKIFGRLFYCIRITGLEDTIVYDFVKKTKRAMPNCTIEDFSGWFYRPEFEDKVIEWWETNFNKKYRRYCNCCGRTEVICYQQPTFNITEVNDGTYCDDCLIEKNYGKCDLTGKMGFRVRLKFSCEKDKKAVQKELNLYKDEMNVINSELPETIRCCYKCDCYYVREDEEDTLCSECKLTRINPYSTKIERFLRARTDDVNEKMFYGAEIEMEVDMDSSIEECAKKINKSLKQFVYLKSDSSISNGFEVVSYAMTYKRWYLALCDFKRTFQSVINGGGYSDEATTTGLHIHLSRAGFKDNYHIARFARCFYLDKYLTEHFACRSFNHYAQFDYGIARDKNYFINGLNNAGVFGDKYHIVNFKHAKTIEIRMFNGTLRTDVIFAHIQFCKLLVEYSRDKENEESLNAKEMFEYLKQNAHSKILKQLIKFYEMKVKYLKEVKTICA